MKKYCTGKATFIFVKGLKKKFNTYAFEDTSGLNTYRIL